MILGSIAIVLGGHTPEDFMARHGDLAGAGEASTQATTVHGMILGMDHHGVGVAIGDHTTIITITTIMDITIQHLHAITQMADHHIIGMVAGHTLEEGVIIVEEVRAT